MSKEFIDTPGAKDAISQEKAFKLLAPLFSIIDKDSVKQIRESQSELNNMIECIDKYNSIFKNNGWIAHELLSYQNMKEAIHVFETTGMEEAEDYLTDYYITRFQEMYRVIQGNKYFHVRKKLLELAYNDFQDERYYSSIPLLLMIVDGIVSDVKGTFILWLKNLISIRVEETLIKTPIVTPSTEQVYKPKLNAI